MDRLNELLQELGISKVKLAKYLGVSRQMVYNYLSLKTLNKWPKEKKILLFKLLNIEDGNEDTLKNIKVNTEYLIAVEGRLNQCLKNSSQIDTVIDIKGLDKKEQELLNNIICIIKEKFSDQDKDHKEFYFTYLYLYHLLQSIDNIPEIKYLLAYISKSSGFTNTKDFEFNNNNQLLFEGIIYSAITLYNSGEANPKRVLTSHNRFVQEMEQKKEEILGRTMQYNKFRVQALRELGYDKVTPENANEFLMKMAEIESRNI